MASWDTDSDDELLGDTDVQSLKEEDVDENLLLGYEDEGEEIELDILADHDTELEGLELVGTSEGQSDYVQQPHEYNGQAGHVESSEHPEAEDTAAGSQEEAQDTSLCPSSLGDDSSFMDDSSVPHHVEQEESESEDEDKEGHGRSRFKSERDISAVKTRRPQNDIPDKLEVSKEDQQAVDKFKRPQAFQRGGRGGRGGRGRAGPGRPVRNQGGRWPPPLMNVRAPQFGMNNGPNFRPGFVQNGQMQVGFMEFQSQQMQQQRLQQQQLQQQQRMQQQQRLQQQRLQQQQQMHQQQQMQQRNFQQQQQQQMRQQQQMQPRMGFVASSPPQHQMGQPPMSQLPFSPQQQQQQHPPQQQQHHHQQQFHPQEPLIQQQPPLIHQPPPRHQMDNMRPPSDTFTPPPPRPNIPHQPPQPRVRPQGREHILDTLMHIAEKRPTSNKILVNPRFMAANRMRWPQSASQPFNQHESVIESQGFRDEDSGMGGPSDRHMPQRPLHMRAPDQISNSSPPIQQGNRVGPRLPPPQNQPRHPLQKSDNGKPFQPQQLSNQQGPNPNPSQHNMQDAGPKNPDKKPLQLTADELEHKRRLEERQKRFAQQSTEPGKKAKLCVKRTQQQDAVDTASPPKQSKPNPVITVKKTEIAKTNPMPVKKVVVNKPVEKKAVQRPRITGAGDGAGDADAQYMKKVEELKHRREQILKMKEMNRKRKMAANKGASEAPQSEPNVASHSDQVISSPPSVAPIQAISTTPVGRSGLAIRATLARGQGPRNIGVRGGAARQPITQQVPDQGQMSRGRGVGGPSNRGRGIGRAINRGRGTGGVMNQGGQSPALQTLRQVSLVGDEAEEESSSQRTVLMRVPHKDFPSQQPDQMSTEAAFTQVMVYNLAGTTSYQKLLHMAQPCGNVLEIMQLDPSGQSVRINFSHMTSAITFVKRYNRAMVDMSIIEAAIV